MTRSLQLRLASLGALALLGLGLGASGIGEGQAAQGSAEEIIRFLTRPREPVTEVVPMDTRFGRLPERDRAAANSLVALGPAAIPAIEAALDHLERSDPGTFGPGSRWLLFAYAKIRGSSALPRLRSMDDHPRLEYLRNDLDTSLAIALGLTSYVSVSHYGYALGCCKEPREALDQFVLAWFQGNRAEFQGVLGPRARSALDSLLVHRSWSSLRREVWYGEPRPALAIGYRLAAPGDWTEPEEALDQALQDRRRVRDMDRVPRDPDLVTKFVGAYGDACGEREVRFALVPVRNMPLPIYSVDDPGLGELLRLITGCALTKADEGSRPAR